MYISFFLRSNIVLIDTNPHFIMSIFTISPIRPSRQMVSHTYTLSSPHSCQTSHLVFSWHWPIHQYLRDTFWTPSCLLLSILLFPNHYGHCRTRMACAQGIPSPLPLALWQSRPTFLYTIPLIFLSTSQFHQHKTGLEKYTQLLHQLVSTRTHGNSDMQINWNTVQLFYLCWKTNIAGHQFILQDGS